MNTDLILQSADSIIKTMSQKSDSWNKGIYSIIATSARSISFSFPQKFTDVHGNYIEYERFTLSNSEDFIEYFKNLNTKERINKLTFYFDDRKFIKSETSWEQSVQDEFEQLLSDAQKNEIKAWYLPDPGKNNEPAQMQLLPKNGVQMDTTALTPDKAFEQLNKAVTYQEDPLWDGGYYSITHKNGQWSGDCGLYLFNTLKSKENNWRADQVDCELLITEEMKTLFLFIQEQYKELNPAVSYDTLFVTVQSDAIRYTTNFELEGVEVSPNAPPMPEVVDASYLCQNLHNCLAYNAPDNYHWLYEVLKRTQTADGKTQLEGVFYYSHNEDKSAPQELEPGEYVYMYNVSQRLFDEFLPDTKGWTEIALYFSREGNVAYRVIKREDQ